MGKYTIYKWIRFKIFKQSDIMIHGQKKSDKTKTPEQLTEEATLSNKINKSLAEFFQIRTKPIQPQNIPQLIQFTAILMQLCNDIGTIFNYRRELINTILQKKQNVENPGNMGKILGGDLKLVSKIMMSDPKSYTLWSYRQWLILKLYKIDKTILDKERQLCKMMLMKDEKNFHVWNYRNWVNSINIQLQSELQFTKTKINSNPFNFSPYHFRSKLLMKKYDAYVLQLGGKIENQEGKVDGALLKEYQEICQFGMPKSVLDEELEMVKTAMFLNPKEEAPWLYYSWLMKHILPAICLQISKDQNSEICTVLFSQKVGNPFEFISNNSCIQMLPNNNTLSNQWKFKAKTGQQEKFAKQTFQIISSEQTTKPIKTETTCRRIIGPVSDALESIKTLYEKEVEFIKQVIEAEQNVCRFGWLQLLQIYNNILYLGTSAKCWQSLVRDALQVFEELRKQKKGSKYIQKQEEYWKRMSQNAKLGETEKLLKSRFSD